MNIIENLALIPILCFLECINIFLFSSIGTDPKDSRVYKSYVYKVARSLC